MPLESPVVLILFNRPDVTARVFASIAQAQPRRLLLIADGPRTPAEGEKTDRARAAVSKVDWDCDVETNFAATNLGCRQRVASGLDWVFQRCDQAIILEDDCLPDLTFFRFCDELLVRYCDDERVSMVSGDNFQAAPRGGASYYFSSIAHVWGWATWRRAWRHFDVDMKSWPADRGSKWLADLVVEPQILKTYQSAFDAVHVGTVDTWDAQWQLAVWRAPGMVALPNVNLVSNLGFGADATHTKLSNSTDARLPTVPIEFPLSHPPSVTRDVDADITTWRRGLATKTISSHR